MGRVDAINVSRKKGTVKTPVPRAELRVDHGVVGDAHAAPGSRQVSLLAVEAIEKALCVGLPEAAGRFAENLAVRDLPPEAYTVGTRLRVGRTVLLEISQIGKECHTRCAIYRQVGDCIMPRMGLFARVLAGGFVDVGDAVEAVR
jgi:MOSC domain-containing protein YiiM